MQYSFMDKLLIDIYNIRNIESIEIKDIVLSMHKNTKSIIVPYLMVEYDGGKMIDLCSLDKYFDTFVKKTVQVYNAEKDRNVIDEKNDPFHLHQNIKIDEHTKAIFENGEVDNIANRLSFYENKEYYDKSLLFKIDTIKILIPIINYHLKKELANMGINVVVDDTLKGYHDRFSLTGKLNGIPTSILLSCDLIDDNKYRFQVGGLLDKNTPIIIEISFMSENINVKLLVDKFNLESSYTYLVNDGIVKEINEALINNKIIYYKNNNLEEVDGNSFNNLITFDGTNECKWFKLPWGSYYGISNSSIPLSSDENNIENATIYLSYSQLGFMKIEHYSRKYKRIGSSYAMEESIILDERIKNTIGICISPVDNIYVIETKFLDTLHMNGYYNEKLSNRCFYHLVKCNQGLENINREDLTNIGNLNGINNYNDIKNHDLVLKHVRGNK